MHLPNISVIPGCFCRGFHAELHSISIRVSVFDIKLLGFAAATAGLRVIARTGQDREAGILRKARVDLAQGAEQK